MANPYSDARIAVRDTLANALGIDFGDGYFEGPLRDFTFGSTWIEEVTVNEANENYAIVLVACRIALAWDPPAVETEPVDSGPLEDVAAAAQVALSTASLNPASPLNAYIVRTPHASSPQATRTASR
jgi:hypothetical protein